MIGLEQEQDDIHSVLVKIILGYYLALHMKPPLKYCGLPRSKGDFWHRNWPFDLKPVIVFLLYLNLCIINSRDLRDLFQFI